MAIAGRVAIVPKGEWSQDITYDKLDLVTYNGNAFISYKPSVGVEPVNGETWMLIMEGVSSDDVENLKTDVESIINGTTPVGDSNKLGGKEASEYALAKELEAHTFTRNTFTEQTACQNFIDNYSANFPNDTSYEFWLNVDYGDDTIFGSGGQYKIIGNKTQNGYDTQIAIRYATNGCLIYARSKYNGTWGKFDTFATTADLANYLPKTGGEITSTGKYDIVTFNDTTHNVVRIGFKSDGVHRGYLAQTEAEDGAFRRITPDGSNYHKILDTGNKPSGSYTGNGSTTARVINTGGIGSVVMIWGNGTSVLVTEDGGRKKSGTTLSGISYSNCTFKRGVLTLVTTDASLNADGVTYYYQVL